MPARPRSKMQMAFGPRRAGVLSRAARPDGARAPVVLRLVGDSNRVCLLAAVGGARTGSIRRVQSYPACAAGARGRPALRASRAPRATAQATPGEQPLESPKR